MADDRYDRVTFHGKSVDKWTRAALLACEKELGYELTIVQGSFNKGVGASAGTHDANGVVDLLAWDHVNKVKALRRNGFAAWYRPTLKNVWSEHIHAVLINNAKAAPLARSQVTAYYNGRNGLANNAKDTEWRPNPIKPFDYEASQAKPPTKPPVVVPPKETEPPVADSCTFNYLGFNIYASQYTGGSFSSKRKAALKATFAGDKGANASWNALSEVNRDLDHNTVVALLGSQFNHKDVYTRAAGNNHHYPDANKWEVTGRLILPLGSTTTQARRITLVTAKHKATGIIASFWAAHFSSATSGASSAQAAASQIVEAKAVAKLIKSNTLPDWDVAKSIGYADTNFDAAEQHIEPAGVKEIAKLVTVADGQFNSLHTLGKAPSKGFRRDNVFVGSKVEVLKARQIMGLYDASDHLGQACQLRVSA